MSYHVTSHMYERAQPILPRGYKPYPDRHLGRPANQSTMAYGPGGALEPNLVTCPAF